MDMLALFKDIINKETNVNANIEIGNMRLYLKYGNNHDAIISILCMKLNFLFIIFVS